MVRLARLPDLHRGELAHQSLVLRLGLVPLFVLVTVAAAGPAGRAATLLGLAQPLVFLVLGYTVSSAVLAAGYRLRALGSSDVLYLGMADTGLFLAVGAYLTGGGASPVLYLFFAMPATYLVLATPRVFVAAGIWSGVAMGGAVSLAALKPFPAGLGGYLPAAPNPLAYLGAATGALALLAWVGWRHSVTFAGRSRARQHLAAALVACPTNASGVSVPQRLFELLDGVMTALRITDEGTIYQYDASQGLLRRQVHLGIRPWFQRFPTLRPGEGNVGYAFQFNSRIVCQSSHQLEDMVHGLTSAVQAAGAETPDTAAAPAHSLAMPLAWQGEVLGVLVLSRQSGQPFTDDEELRLAASFAASMAGAMGQAHLQQRVARLEVEVAWQRRLQSLLPALDLRGGVQGFASQLRELLPFDCLKVVVCTPDGLDESSSYFWCPGDLDLTSATLDPYAEHLLSRTYAGGKSGPVPVPPDLADRGVSSMAAVLAPFQSGPGGPLQGGLLLLHRQPDAYGAPQAQVLLQLEPYVPLLFALAAGWGMWDRKKRQMESLHQVVDLTQAGGDQQRIVQSVILWAAEQVGPALTGPVFAVLSDRDKGTLTVTAQAPDSATGFQRELAGAGSDELQQMFNLWTDAEPRLLADDETLSRKVFPLLPAALTGRQVLGFPFRIAGNTHGVLAVPLSNGYAADQERRASIQQFLGVASLCLRNCQLYEAQTRQARELRHEDELRRSFISFITHEFRTPLTSLKASFDLVREADEVQGLADPYQRLLKNMGRSVATLEQLISDLAEVANLSAGGVLLNRYWTSPASIVHPVIEMSAPLSHLKNQTLEAEVQAGLPDIMADSRRLEQVLSNLVSNAIKYTPAGGAIRVSVVREGQWIKFAVTDTGRGIPPEYVARLFQPFFRVPHGSVEYAPGTGLGLALAKTLVELHGGKIWVETAPEKGCAFYFTVPVP